MGSSEYRTRFPRPKPVFLNELIWPDSDLPFLLLSWSSSALQSLHQRLSIDMYVYVGCTKSWPYNKTFMFGQTYIGEFSISVARPYKMVRDELKMISKLKLNLPPSKIRREHTRVARTLSITMESVRKWNFCFLVPVQLL